MTLRRLLILHLAAATACAAQAYSVKARATDPSGEGIIYATYRVYPDSIDTPLHSNTTDDSGRLSQQLAAPGRYRLALSYVGMRDTTVAFEVDRRSPDARLGDIVLHEAAEMLEGVTVTAQRPLVVKEIDRIGYDVKADPAAKTSSVRDILRKVPMLSVQPDGTILVNGSSNFKIYKNGRPNNSMSRNAKDLFAAMPASMIKKIEVITEPGAEYDAEGTTAILNIVTDSESVVKGLMGTASVDWRTGSDLPGGNLWLSGQLDKVTVSAYGGMSGMSGRSMRQRSENVTTFPATGASRRESTGANYHGDIEFFGFEGSYEPDSLNLFTAEMSGYSYSLLPRYNLGHIENLDNAGAITGAYDWSMAQSHNNYFDIDANFNYQRLTRHKGERYTLSYMVSTTRQHNAGHTDYSGITGDASMPYTTIDYTSRQHFIEHTFQADWTRPLDIHTLNAGAKWIIRRNHTIGSRLYEDWQDTHTDFRHITDIGAVYAQYGVRLGRVGLRAGLRYEYSRLKADYPDGSGTPFATSLHDLVPSAALSWQIADPSSLTLNYSSSISRPGISYLNPVHEITPTSVSYGNPDLESSRRQSVKLQYMYIGSKLNFNVGADYAFVNNGISPVNFITDGDIINSTYANVVRTRNVSLSAFVQWSPGSKTRLMVNASANYAHNTQEGLTLSRWTPNFYGSVTQQLPWRLSVEAMLWYGAGGLNGVYGYQRARFSQNSYHSFALSRGFLREDRLNVRLSLDNIFGSRERVYESVVVNGDYRSTSRNYQNHGRQLRMSVSYRFGSMRAQVKKVGASIKNEDLVGRKM